LFRLKKVNSEAGIKSNFCSERLLSTLDSGREAGLGVIELNPGFYLKSAFLKFSLISPVIMEDFDI